MERVDVIRIHFKMAATIIKKKWGGFYFGNQTFTWKSEQGNNGADLWPPTCRHQGTTWLSRIVYSPFSCWFSCLFIYLFIHLFIHSFTWLSQCWFASLDLWPRQRHGDWRRKNVAGKWCHMWWRVRKRYQVRSRRRDLERSWPQRRPVTVLLIGGH